MVIGCLPRVLEVPRVTEDTKVPWILWVKCATSAECKTIQIVVSMVKDSWVVLLKLRPEFYQPRAGVLIKLFGLSQMAWHDDQVGLVSNSAYVDICNLFIRISVLSWCILYIWIDHVIALETSFLQTTYLVLYHCIIVPCSNHGLLASTFKVLIGCHWLLNWPGMEEQEFKEEFFVDEHAN